MAELFFDLYFRGMMKMVVGERDQSLFRGMDRVAHEYARRLPQLQAFDKYHLFGSRLPFFTEETLRRIGLKEGNAPVLKATPRERFLRWINRTEEKYHGRFAKINKAIFAAGRRLGMVGIDRGFFAPATPRKGDVWLTAMSQFTPAIRRLPVERVIFCYDFSHVYHYREMGLSEPKIHPLLNLAFDVRPDEWVICISEYTKKCFLKFHKHFPEERVVVIPLGGNPTLPKDLPPEADVLSCYGLKSGKYLLSLAAAAKHKNIAYAAEEFLRWKEKTKLEQSIKLVLAGRNQKELVGSFSDSVQQAISEGSIVFTGYLPDAHLPAVYRNALAFIFPSLAEGFGLPPLEAMGYGAPVLCSNRTSMPEVVGDAALLFDPETPGALVNCLDTIFDNECLRQELIFKGKKRSLELTWERASERLITTLKDISRRASAAAALRPGLWNQP